MIFELGPVSHGPSMEVPIFATNPEGSDMRTLTICVDGGEVVPDGDGEVFGYDGEIVGYDGVRWVRRRGRWVRRRGDHGLRQGLCD